MVCESLEGRSLPDFSKKKTRRKDTSFFKGAGWAGKDHNTVGKLV